MARCSFFVGAVLLLSFSLSWGGDGVRQPRRQTLYVPVYSHVFSGSRTLEFELSATLSVRHTDLTESLSATAVDYHDNDGKLLRHYLDNPEVLGPLGSTQVFVPEKDTSGGFGANFIVRWQAEEALNAPIVECVLIGTRSGQGISFISPARVIHE